MQKHHVVASELMLAGSDAQGAQQGVAVLSSQPTWVHGGALYPHQLEAVNWLRRLWAEGRPALLADGGGLGKTASIITFLQSLRCHTVRPRTFCTRYTIQMDAS